jgi:hypothetical protein
MSKTTDKYFGVIHREEIDKLAEKMAIACAAQTVMNRSPEEVATWAYRCASEFVAFKLRRNEVVDLAENQMLHERSDAMRSVAMKTIDELVRSGFPADHLDNDFAFREAVKRLGIEDEIECWTNLQWEQYARLEADEVDRRMKSATLKESQP